MDLAPFYPKFLWESPSAPLHFLIALRESYVHSSGDPFFSHAGRQQPAWFRASLYIEFAFQLPLAMYLVFQLVSRRAISGATELAGLAFGCLTGMGSILCCAELYHLGPEVLSEEKKSNLLYGTYLPFAVIREYPFTIVQTRSCYWNFLLPGN